MSDSELPPVAEASTTQAEKASPTAKPARPRQLVSSACQACRSKRIKCKGGPPPCEACAQRQIECVFNVEADQRRRLARKHKAEEADFHQRLLYGMLNTLRSNDTAQVEELVAVVQNNASLNDIMAVIERQLDAARQLGPQGRQASVELEELRHEVQTLQHMSPKGYTRRKVVAGADLEEALRREDSLGSSSEGLPPTSSRKKPSEAESSDSMSHRKVMAIQELVSTAPLFEVPAAPWTTITKSDRLVSHLMSIYFSWWNPFFRIVDQNAFTLAMQSGDLNSRLCSPFLVHAILAIATQYCDAPRIFMVDDDVTTRGQAFHDEAQRLWTEEHGRASLCNLQGLYLLICSYARLMPLARKRLIGSSNNIRGRDRAGWTALSQMITMYNELALFRRLPTPKLKDPALAVLVQNSYRQTAWAVVNLAVMFSLVMLKPVHIAIEFPQYGLPYSNEVVNEMSLWMPYPDDEPRPVPLNASTNAQCELLRLCWNIPTTLFDNNGQLRPDLTIVEVEGFIKEMEAWRANLPDSLQPSVSAPSVVFENHMLWFSMLIMLFTLLMHTDLTPPGTPRATHQRTLISRTISLVRETIPLFRTYDRLYGLSNPPVFVNQAAVAGANALLRASFQSEDHKNMFSELVTIMIASGRQVLIWQGTVLMLRRTASHLGVQLPEQDEARLEAFESEHWPQLAETGKGKFSSMYPNYAFTKGADDTADEAEWEMGELIDRWTILRLEEKEEKNRARRGKSSR